ncbi:hypothetical protein [Nocardia jiangxiensis]|uniref:hypothetical protein n=1 Tax=Nocardia jiangxiensis TaxID=282685 RepID=UPI0012F6D266|nr:hypothetical protein [Nocardia jiangxiensis]
MPCFERIIGLATVGLVVRRDRCRVRVLVRKCSAGLWSAGGERVVDVRVIEMRGARPRLRHGPFVGEIVAEEVVEGRVVQAFAGI